MVIKYTKIFHSKTLQNLPKLGFLVLKQTIWQPWFERFKKVRTVESISSRMTGSGEFSSIG
jgi:hypothetical protein